VRRVLLRRHRRGVFGGRTGAAFPKRYRKDRPGDNRAWLGPLAGRSRRRSSVEPDHSGFLSQLSSRQGRAAVAGCSPRPRPLSGRGSICEVCDIESVPQTAAGGSDIDGSNPIGVLLIGRLARARPSARNLRGAGSGRLRSGPRDRRGRGVPEVGQGGGGRSQAIAKAVVVYRLGSPRQGRTDGVAGSVPCKPEGPRRRSSRDRRCLGRLEAEGGYRRRGEQDLGGPSTFSEAAQTRIHKASEIAPPILALRRHGGLRP